MLYFRSRKRGTKYAFEAMRLITYVKALYTEQMSHRIIHGQFVNVKGGKGNNYANDLKMENLVKNNKVILKGMCGNKTIKAVERSTSAAYGLKKIIDVFDKKSGVSSDSSSLTHKCTSEDVKEMIEILTPVKPFNKKPGRKLLSFPNISKSPLDQLDTAALFTWLNRHKRRLSKNAYAACDDDCDDEEDDESDDEEEEEYILEDD